MFAGIRSNEEGVPLDEENFDEAIRHTNAALVPTNVRQTQNQQRMEML